MKCRLFKNFCLAVLTNAIRTGKCTHLFRGRRVLQGQIVESKVRPICTPTCVKFVFTVSSGRNRLSNGDRSSCEPQLVKHSKEHLGTPTPRGGVLSRSPARLGSIASPAGCPRSFGGSQPARHPRADGSPGPAECAPRSLCPAS